ncbi:cell division protein FtsL [Lacticaseibacillus yichunensis]|uniref:Cell division protein FtsL n=1 Tax=Lacticaseibacillus yichunensis TaxID=2486015 RepID=A0ABW4CR43_9LACO|nr:cell division protein FtsL [Lacticaseibacillus yichunensis]
MLDNTARQLDAAEPLRTAPVVAPTPTAAPAPAAAPAPKHIAFAPLERLLTVLCGLAVVAFCLMYLGTQNSLAATNRTYQDLQSQISSQNQQIDDYKQTVGELSNSDRLANFAKAHGLTVINGNIKRVTDK